MQETEKKAAGVLLARMAGILDVAEDVVEQIMVEVTEARREGDLKTGNILGDLIKLIQLLEKQYEFLRLVEKEQAAAEELPQPDEAVIRNYLNEKHAQQHKTRAAKALQKGKEKR